MTEPRQPTRQRETLDVRAGLGGWPTPWPNVEELAAVLPTERWTLVGGLMTQVHSIHRGLGVVRPTNDVDIVTSGPRDRDMHIDTVDVLTADHPAPRVEETLLGRRMVKIQGGTQALRRTVTARLEISPGRSPLSASRPVGRADPESGRLLERYPRSGSASFRRSGAPRLHCRPARRTRLLRRVRSTTSHHPHQSPSN